MVKGGGDGLVGRQAFSPQSRPRKTRFAGQKISIIFETACLRDRSPLCLSRMVGLMANSNISKMSDSADKLLLPYESSPALTQAQGGHRRPFLSVNLDSPPPAVSERVILAVSVTTLVPALRHLTTTSPPGQLHPEADLENSTGSKERLPFVGRE
jgi:hypothetical protein